MTGRRDASFEALLFLELLPTKMTLKHSSCNARCALLFELTNCFPETNVGVERILHFHAVERNEVKLRYVATGLLVSKLGNDGLDAGRLQKRKRGKRVGEI